MTEWDDMEVSDELAERMLKYGMLEKVEVFRTTPLFDHALNLYAKKFGILLMQPENGVVKF